MVDGFVRLVSYVPGGFWTFVIAVIGSVLGMYLYKYINNKVPALAHRWAEFFAHQSVREEAYTEFLAKRPGNASYQGIWVLVYWIVLCTSVVLSMVCLVYMCLVNLLRAAEVLPPVSGLKEWIFPFVTVVLAICFFVIAYATFNATGRYIRSYYKHLFIEGYPLVFKTPDPSEKKEPKILL